MNKYYQKYIEQIIQTKCGDNVQIVAVDYDTPYMYGYSDKIQEYVIVKLDGLIIGRKISFDWLRAMAEEGRIYT